MTGDWHPEDIKAEIRKRGGNLSDLARTAGVTTQAVSAALSGRASERLEAHVAEFLGTTPHKIWPSRYDNKGNRMHLIRRKTERKAA